MRHGRNRSNTDVGTPRWWVTLLSSALAVMLVLVACAGEDPEEAQVADDVIGEEQPEAPTSEEDDEATEPLEGTIRMMMAEGVGGRALAQGVQNFSAETGIEVEMSFAPSGEVQQQQILELSQGSGNLDVILAVDGWIPLMFEHLEPLGPYLDDAPDLSADDFVPGMLGLFATDEADYALPVRVGGRVLVYRTDLYEAAGIEGPPETWDELRENAETIQEMTDGEVSGLVAVLRQGRFLAAQWTAYMRSFGADVLTEDLNQAAFNNPGGIASVQWLVDMYNDGLMPEASIEEENDGVITRMQQGTGAHAIAFSPWFLEMNDPEVSEVSGDLGVAPALPVWPESGLDAGISEMGGFGVGINTYSDNKELAWELISYLASHEAQLDLAVDEANAPTVQSVYGDPAYLDVFPEAEGVLATLSNASWRPQVEEWGAIEEALYLALSAAVLGDKTVEESLADAEDQVNAVLGN